ncbi:hypothetical protein BH09DEP1_BH09DEP1_7710 [soil metagenome]
MNYKKILFAIILLNTWNISFCTFPKDMRDKYVENQKAAYAKIGIGTLYMLPALLPIFAPALVETLPRTLLCAIVGFWPLINGGAMILEGFMQRNQFKNMEKTQEVYDSLKNNTFNLSKTAYQEFCKQETNTNRYIVDCFFDRKFLSGAALASLGLIAAHYVFKQEPPIALYGSIASGLLVAGIGRLQNPHKSCMPTLADFKNTFISSFKGKTS